MTKKMPAEEETYINIDCLDEQTGEVLPLCKEEKHKGFTGRTGSEKK